MTQRTWGSSLGIWFSIILAVLYFPEAKRTWYILQAFQVGNITLNKLKCEVCLPKKSKVWNPKISIIDSLLYLRKLRTLWGRPAASYSFQIRRELCKSLALTHALRRKSRHLREGERHNSSLMTWSKSSPICKYVGSDSPIRENTYIVYDSKTTTEKCPRCQFKNRP